MSGDVSVKGDWPKLKVRGDLAMDEARFEIGEEVLKETSVIQARKASKEIQDCQGLQVPRALRIHP